MSSIHFRKQGPIKVGETRHFAGGFRQRRIETGFHLSGALAPTQWAELFKPIEQKEKERQDDIALEQSKIRFQRTHGHLLESRGKALNLIGE